MKIFSCPDEVPAPVIDHRNFDFNKIEAAEKEHSEKLKQWLIKSGYKGKHTGVIYHEPAGDGHASYMLADNGRKSALIHLPYGDAWHSQNVQFIPKAEILKRSKGREKVIPILGTRKGIS